MTSGFNLVRSSIPLLSVESILGVQAIKLLQTQKNSRNTRNVSDPEENSSALYNGL